jgi:riboflavin kinase/FMN adenylyltransferase
VLHDAGPLPAFERGTAVTIGAFDGVHIGHTTLIAETRRLAAELGCPSVLVTLDRHPATVVRPASAPPLLVDETQKFELLAATGIDYVLVVHFDGERSLEGSEEFVREVIVDELHARFVVVGEDFHFGHRRKGDVALLDQLGVECGFKVVGLKLVGLEGLDGPVTSTSARYALASGDVELAARLLGRLPEIHGIVEHGDHRGRTIGFPTANVAVHEGAVPADLVLVCGVFGNIGDNDIAHTINTLPSLCAPGATVIWTRHRRPPDRTVLARDAFVRAGFEEVAYDAPDGFLFGVGTHRLASQPTPFEPRVEMFTFVGYDALDGRDSRPKGAS